MLGIFLNNQVQPIDGVEVGIVKKYGICFFACLSLLKYNCFTMLCQGMWTQYLSLSVTFRQFGKSLRIAVWFFFFFFPNQYYFKVNSVSKYLGLQKSCEDDPRRVPEYPNTVFSLINILPFYGSFLTVSEPIVTHY